MEIAARIDDRDWSQLAIGERIAMVEREGYAVIPDLLDQAHLERLRGEASKFDTTPVDYSDKQRGRRAIEFTGGAITELIAHQPTIVFLKELFGDEVIFMSYTYARSEPGHPGISLHTDGQPYGSQIFGYEGSCPCVVRVLYYLDDLTPEVSPFRVVPRSHLSMHRDANPYRRYVDHPGQVMVTATAGSAVFLNHRVFHGNFPNTGTRARQMLAIAYRPGWAGPQKEVSTWTDSQLASLPVSVRPFFADRNTRHWDFGGANKPDDMPSVAPGIDPSRWERTD